MSAEQAAFDPDTIRPAATLLGAGALTLWGETDPGAEDEFNDWYTHEHIPERMAVPGFLRARRYVEAVRDSRMAPWKYFTLYETEALATLRSEGYLRMLENPTQRTRKYLPHFAAMSRTACRVTASLGIGIGGNAAVLELAPEGDRGTELRSWITGSFVPDLLSRSGYLGVHLLESDEDATEAGSGTAAYQGMTMTGGRWIVIIEGAWTRPAGVITEHLADIERLRQHGARPDVSYKLFQLLCYASGS
ncbi:MAG: hypothetical protein GEU98_14410 [Pseudonocardiaceae bacterium]|nr:hypothetical protein [Pseudonocardiaceae bacterium]